MILDVLVCMLLLHLFQLLTPFWWWILIIPLLFGLVIPRKPVRSFFTGAVSGGILWLVYSFYLKTGTSRIILDRISVMMGITELLILVITFLIAFLAAGSGSLSGTLIRVTISGRKLK